MDEAQRKQFVNVLFSIASDSNFENLDQMSFNLEGRATQITEEMKLAAALAIASLVPEDELNEDNIMPEAFDPRVADVVSAAVKAHIAD